LTPISLFELNNLVKELLTDSFTDTYWVTAELSEVRVSAKGHCFLELVEKGERGSAPVAKAHAVIMSYLFPMLKMTFEEATGQSLVAGLKVQLEVAVSFNEVYGYSLVVKDIDPDYTMGSLARLRKEILEHLERDGVIDMNKELTLPRPLQRIAVVSSATAAGYGDFCNQLNNNVQGYRFVYRLFPAVMQGETTAASVISALDDIAAEYEQWDAVAIIRGGGAVSDLAGFEDYDLAAYCAQFPLPIITGIGHERDTTVLDFVANTHLKTPTAVAAFLIEQMDEEARWIETIENMMLNWSLQRLHASREWLTNVSNILNTKALNVCRNRENVLVVVYERLYQNAQNIINAKRILQKTSVLFIYHQRSTIRSRYKTVFFQLIVEEFFRRCAVNILLICLFYFLCKSAHFITYQILLQIRFNLIDFLLQFLDIFCSIHRLFCVQFFNSF